MTQYQTRSKSAKRAARETTKKCKPGDQRVMERNAMKSLIDRIRRTVDKIVFVKMERHGRPMFALWRLVIVLLAAFLLLVPTKSNSIDLGSEHGKVLQEDTMERGVERGKVGEDGTVNQAMGGTELMNHALMKRLPEVFQKRFHIIKSRIVEGGISKDKQNILWLHDLPSDPESRHFQDPNSAGRFDKIVFVSEWQRKQYQQYFQQPFSNSVVLRNAIDPIPVHEKSRSGPLRLIYHTTPHRGLEILMPVFIELHKRLGSESIVLDVYSSYAIYGWESRNQPYEPLFDMCRNHPACNYYGTVSNEEIRAALQKAHIFAYPSIFPETSSIAVIEALSAGCEIVTSSLGALPETLNGFGHIYPYVENPKQHMASAFQALDHTIKTYWTTENMQKRKRYTIFAAQMYSWGFFGFNGRIEEWIQMLTMIDRDGAFWGIPQRNKFHNQEDFVNALVAAGRNFERQGNAQNAFMAYQQALSLDPTNAHAMVAGGHLALMKSDAARNEEMALQAIDLLQKAVDPPEGMEVHSKITPDMGVFYDMIARISYYLGTRHYESARQWLQKGLRTSYPHDDCFELFQATLIPHVPSTEEVAAEMIAMFHKDVDELMKRDFFTCSNIHALSSAFPLAYYDLDFKDEMKKWNALYAKAFPILNYKAEKLEVHAKPKAPLPYSKERKVKVGVVSSFFSPESSIWGNFGFTLRFLQEHPMLDVSFVYYPDDPNEPPIGTMSQNPQTNLYLEKIHTPESLMKNRKMIEARQFDILLYLDLWIRDDLNQLALGKLAPVQICTHGHPLTSAVPREIMDYYLSWEAAELPDREIAQSFYTEELILLPGDKPWEYYVPRTKDGVSLFGHQSFGHYTKATIDFLPDERAEKVMKQTGANWYFCSQAPFKYHFVFDQMLSKIQKADPHAVIVLVKMQAELSHLHPKMEHRLQNAGVDLDRVVFMQRMPHPQLMAMYNVSDVILDSAYFGGDTTTREAFEVGSPIITLPHKTIGQRWTQAYYKMIGITEFIANDPDQYVQLAVEVATSSDEEKQAIRKRIREASHKNLYQRADCHSEWANALLALASRPRKWHWGSTEGNYLQGSSNWDWPTEF